MARLSAAAPAECSLATLGSFELRIRGKPVPSPSTLKARALLAYLAFARRTDVARERLIDVFWPDAEPERARDSLNTALHSIRRGLRAADLDPNEFLFANKSIVRWETDVDFDVERVERALEKGDPGAVSEALASYRGDFLEGDYDQWSVGRREAAATRYEELLGRAVRSTKAPDAAKKLLARNPYDEEAYAALIDAEIEGGRYLSAAHISRQCAQALKEVGAAPSPQFLARYSGLEHASPASSASLDVPFVGRNAELQELLSLLEGGSAAQALAIVEGEPGIGKTALLDRFAKTAAQRGSNVVVLRAIPDDARPFAIWASLYASLSGEEFDAFLHRVHGAAADELGAALLRNFGPSTVLIVDDAQYLRADALQTLVVLAKHVASARAHVMAIGTRSEGFADLAARLGETPYAAVGLSPLSDADVDSAIALAGVELDAAASGAFRSRARGHPLYVKGLLEQLVRSGAMQREGGRWRLTSAQADLELPASLRRLIEARIRSRGSVAVNVACALALEPAATPLEIAHACELTEMQVLDALDDLLGHRIVVEPQTGPRHFAFAHDLLAEAARGLLPSARRTRLHARFGHVLQTSEVRERSVRSAVHFEAAGSFADAARAYLNAVQESAELQAPHATLERTDAGLRCAAQLAPSPHLAVLVSKLLQYRSFAHRLLWNLEACLQDAEHAVDQARAGGDPRCTTDALVVLKSAINIGDMDRERALSVARELGAVAEQLRDEELIAQSLIDEGHAYRIAMDCDRAHPVLGRALDAAVRSGSPQLIVKAGIQLLSLQAMWWRLQHADQTASLVLENLARVDWAYRAHAWLVLAMFSTELERYEQAQTYLEGVRKILESSPLKRAATAPNVARPEIAIRADYFAGVLDAACARWDRGLGSFCSHLPMYETLLHEVRYAKLFAAARADLLLGRNAPGDDDAVLAELPDAGAQWVPETGFQPSHAPLVVRARLFARRGEKQAHALLDEALAFLDAEHVRLPMGTDAAYARIAQAALEAGAHPAARRAARAHERLRRQKLEAAGILVSV